MSADNGVYILKTLARGAKYAYVPLQEGEISPFYVYRVLHAQAIENIYYRVESQSDHDLFDQRTFVPEVAYEYFKECQPLFDEGRALIYAHQLADQTSILEYGVEILDHGEQVFQTFTDEEIQTFEQRSDEIMSANRKKRDAEMDAKRNAATVDLGPVGNFQPTSIVGFITDSDGERTYGRLTGDMENVGIARPVEEPLNFLPNDWDRR